MSLAERISHASGLNSQLLQQLGETEPGHLALPKSQSNATSLQQQVNNAAAAVKRLHARTEKELKDLQDQRDSSVRKNLYRFSGRKEKFEARTEKEKTEYHEALAEEKRANDKLESLRNDLANVQNALNAHEAASKQHVDLQRQLDDLYNALFAGPTPDFPDEDNLEGKFRIAKDDQERARSNHVAEVEVLKLLDHAEAAMRRAISDMASARNMSTMDTLGGGTMVSMMKRDAMDKARSSATQAQRLIAEAQNRSKDVQGFGQLQFARSSGMTDVFFDNIFTDMRVRDEIIQSQDQLMNAARQLSDQIRLARSRCERLQQDANKSTDDLEIARRNLQRRREGIFQQLCQQPSPPAYSNSEIQPTSHGEYQAQSQLDHQPQGQPGYQSQSQPDAQPQSHSEYQPQGSSGYKPQGEPGSWYSS